MIWFGYEFVENDFKKAGCISWGFSKFSDGSYYYSGNSSYFPTLRWLEFLQMTGNPWAISIEVSVIFSVFELNTESGLLIVVSFIKVLNSPPFFLVKEFLRSMFPFVSLTITLGISKFVASLIESNFSLDVSEPSSIFISESVLVSSVWSAVSGVIFPSYKEPFSAF